MKTTTHMAIAHETAACGAATNNTDSEALFERALVNCEACMKTDMIRFQTINLTQHDTTPEQRADGVADRIHPGLLAEMLTFSSLPSPELISDRAEALARHAVSVYERWEIPAGTRDSDASDWPQAMIGGAPFLMAALERALVSYRICPVYAFSTRESAEEAMPDGSVRKVAVFRHLGLVQSPLE